MHKCKMTETVIDGTTIKTKDCLNCENLKDCDADTTQAEYLCQEEQA